MAVFSYMCRCAAHGMDASVDSRLFVRSHPVHVIASAIFHVMISDSGDLVSLNRISARVVMIRSQLFYRTLQNRGKSW